MSEQEYTDEQFHADLKKASKWLDAMIEKAHKEHAEGRTRKFPTGRIRTRTSTEKQI